MLLMGPTLSISDQLVGTNGATLILQISLRFALVTWGPRKAPVPSPPQTFLESSRLSHMSLWVYLLAVTALCWCSWALPQRPPSLCYGPGEKRPRPSVMLLGTPGVLTSPESYRNLREANMCGGTMQLACSL